MTGRRAFVGVFLGCLLAGAVVVIASGRTWGRASLATVTGSVDRVTVTGHGAEPALPALGIALLVLTAGLIAARGWLRRVVGLIVVVVGAVMIALAVASRSDVATALEHRAFAVRDSAVAPHTSAWAVVSALAGVLAVACGAVTVFVGSRWPALGARYDAAGARGARRDGAANAMSEWDALDRGEDPTV